MSVGLNLVITKKAIVLLLAFLFLQIFWFSTLSHADTIRIGLRAHHGIEKSMKQWKQTADYLSEKIPEHKFVFVPFVGLAELMDEVKQNKFDFVLTNPSSFVEMEVELGASAILTLRNKRQDKPFTQFGSVIFTRKNNDDINNISDLKDKKIVAVSKRAFGGWRVAKRELILEGFDAEKLEQQVSFSGGIQQDVVSIIQLGNADVGVVRTDMLERMTASGIIKLDDFKIINKKLDKNFPFLRSTRLYPEWPFVKMRDTSSELSKKVALALLTISSQNPAAIAGKYIGWTVKEDYQPVHDLMKDLKVGPYQKYDEHPFEHFLEEYLIHILIFAFLFIVVLFFSLYVLSTNRKLLEAKSQQDKLLSELESRVSERTKDLKTAKEHAEKASEAKSEFLSSMSHELRTPMNAILGFAQIIEYDVSHNNLEQVENHIDEILVAGRHLLELVNDVLDLAKIETGKYEVNLQKIIVSKAINDVLSLLKVLASKKQISLICEFENDDLSVMADLRSFRQALINIITNAIKYNHADGSITISVQRQDDGYCKISIADTGEGIAEDSISKIFEPFERVSNRSNIEGSGVGLSITKNLIEIMDGKIIVESKLGVGSTFSIFFRIAH